ncbi:hypothetical protein LLG96_08690 [bacterium]|nr:hypothetical protein [bacterium]
MKKSGLLTICIAVVMIMAALPCWPETGLDGRKQIVLDGNIASVSVDIAGGSIVDFHLNKQGLNPLHWNYPEKGDTKPRMMGHFICFDRWGPPSDQELKNGMPFHGEATQVEWKILSRPQKTGNAVNAVMLCELPIGGMTLKRTMSLCENAPVLMVKEEITNTNKLGKVYNIVQHPSIAPPFLDESVIVDCNAWKGFIQDSPWPHIEEPVIYWPATAYKGSLVDFRRLGGDHNPDVASFVFADSLDYGWVTACNPEKRLMLGYIWKLSDYPWLDIWRNSAGGKPDARGLEFGTTGLHRQVGDMMAKGKILDRPLFEYCDAGQTITKSYVAFITEIPAGYKGAEAVSYSADSIVIRERESTETRDIIINLR